MHFGRSLAPFWLHFGSFLADMLVIPKEKRWFSKSHKFRKKWKIINFGIHFGIILGAFWHHFSMLFRHRFLDVFLDTIFSIFDQKWLPKWSGKKWLRSPFGAHFRDLFRSLIFWCLWLHFDSLRLPCGSLLAHFWFLQVLFWIPSGLVGFLFVTFLSIEASGQTFGFDPFGHGI